MQLRMEARPMSGMHFKYVTNRSSLMNLASPLKLHRHNLRLFLAQILPLKVFAFTLTNAVLLMTQ